MGAFMKKIESRFQIICQYFFKGHTHLGVNSSNTNTILSYIPPFVNTSVNRGSGVTFLFLET
jgi:hypothetical protein